MPPDIEGAKPREVTAQGGPCVRIPIRISSEGAADNKTGRGVPTMRFFGLRPLNEAIPPGPLPSDPEGAKTDELMNR